MTPLYSSHTICSTVSTPKGIHPRLHISWRFRALGIWISLSYLLTPCCLASLLSPYQTSLAHYDCPTSHVASQTTYHTHCTHFSTHRVAIEFLTNLSPLVWLRVLLVAWLQCPPLLFVVLEVVAPTDTTQAYYVCRSCK